MKKGFFLGLLIFSSFAFSKTQPQQIEYKVHLLKEGETLSELLWKNDFKPLYGESQWVDKILKINRLNAEQAQNLKQDIPIILPTKKTRKILAQTKVDQVKTVQSSTIHYGLVGNQISKHQDIMLDFSIHERQTQIRNKTISQTGNFQLGFSYHDKNSRKLNAFNINPQLQANITAMAPARFTDRSEQSVTFQPTYELRSNFILTHPEISYQVGPYIQLLEQSGLDSKTKDDYFIRRDRMANIGLMAQKIYERNNIQLHFNASLGTTLLSQNLGDDSIMQIVQSRFNSKVNLTRDYYIGAFWETNYFSNSAQEIAQNFGINLTYNIK